MAKRKVILFLVEGTGDLTALARPFKTFFERKALVEGEAFYCDVTTASLYPKDVTFRVCERVEDTVRQFILDQIQRKRSYLWKDLVEVIHVVDLDGAFIPDECVVQDDHLDAISYESARIVASNAEGIRKRNEVKRKALGRLIYKGFLAFHGVKVPYHVYFMSRNLEHALFGIEKELDADTKELLSQKFSEKCQENPQVLIDRLNNSEVRVDGDYLTSWKAVQEGTASLKRGSNLGLLLDA